MCEIRAVSTVAALLLAANGFCIHQVNSEKKVGHHSEIKTESPCEKEYKKFCRNEWFYLNDEEFVGCNCTWIYG